MTSKAIGLLGGTFDPIHEGHLAIAEQVYKALSLSYVDFIPCFLPPHRKMPGASAQDRLKMVKLAIADHQNFRLNTIEFEKKQISYTIDTLQLLREKNPTQPFCFIIGEDAFACFDTWHEYQKILALTHLIVVTRKMKTITYSQAAKTLQQTHETKNINDLHHQSAGSIYFLSIPPIPFSATKIRTLLAENQKGISGLPAVVKKYIKAHHLYKLSTETS